MPSQNPNPIEVHEQNFADGVNMDIDENKMPNTAAYFLKNAINGINNGSGINQEGFSLESLTKLVANFTDFPIANIFPFFRNYTIDLTSLVYPITAFSWTVDWVELPFTKAPVLLHNAFDTNAFMISIGWTQGFGQVFTINNTQQWQFINFLKSDNTFESIAPTFTGNGAAWGNNTAIGFKYDVKLNQYFVFNFNDSDRHLIWMYDANLNTYQSVLETPILNFALNHRITAINVVLLPTKNNAGIETIERLLYWTDNFNQCRKINIDRCLDKEYLDAPMDYVSEDEFMRVIKFAPYPYPSFDATQAPDVTVTQNYIQRSLLQFMIRHICDDKEQTVYSSISDLFVPEINPDSTNQPNFVLLQNLDAGSEIVINIEIAYRTSNIDQWLTYILIPRADVLSQSKYSYNALTNQFQYKFFRNRQSIPIADVVSSKNYDEVPQEAISQELLTTNMIAYGGGINGYDNFDVTPVTVSVNVNQVFLELFFTCTITMDAVSDNNGMTIGLIQSRNGIEKILQTSQVVIDSAHQTVVATIDYQLYDFQIGDLFYIKILFFNIVPPATAFTIKNSVTQNTFRGTYTGISPNTGDWLVHNNTDQVNPNIGDRITFTFAIGPNTTFTLNNPASPNTTNFDTCPNNSGSFNGHLKNGGKYQVGITGKDDAGRESFIQTMDSLLVSIPSIQDNDGIITNPIITATFNGLVVPDWVDTLHFSLTHNLVLNNGAFGQSFIQWQINTPIFYKSDGTVGDPAIDTIAYITFTLYKLIEYNTQYQLNTTTTYTWTKGDRVNFISYDTTGTPQPFTTTIDLQIKSIDSITFTCDYNLGLSVLKDSFGIVEIYTPNSNVGTEIFYERHTAVKCTGVMGNNQPVVSSVVIHASDTYIVLRTMVGLQQAFSYESPSAYDSELVPSNGEDIGRVNVVNPFAQRVTDYSLIQYSNAFNPDSQINGLSTFDSGDSKLYFQGSGAINKLYCDGNYNLLALQEEKAIRIVIGKKLLTDNAGGSVVAVTDEILSDPIEINGNYGCQNPETFVVTQNGLLLWTDLKRGREVICDWKTAADRGEWGYDAYAMSKLKYISNSNNQGNPTIYLQSGYDPLNDIVHTTSFQPSQGFINSASSTDITLNETWGSYVNRKKFAGHFSFTPEWFGICEGYRTGAVMIAFKNGVPFYHNNSTTYNYNTFFGTPCRQYIGMVAHDVLVRNNLQVESYLIGRKTKNWLNIGVDTRDNTLPQSAVMYEPIYVTTSLNQLSNTPVASSKFREGIQWMPFFKDTTGGGTIINGRNLKGTYVKFLLMDNASAQNVYNRLNKILVTFNNSSQTF